MEWASLRCRTLLPAQSMNEARRTEAILSSDPRAWEQLVEKSSPEPVSGRATSDIGDPFMFGKSLQYTTAPTREDLDRVHSKLVALRDAVLVPIQSSTEENAFVFDNFETKNSSRSSRWDGWKMLPPWSVHSLAECPLAEVRVLGEDGALCRLTSFCRTGFEGFCLGVRFGWNLITCSGRTTHVANLWAL